MTRGLALEFVGTGVLANTLHLGRSRKELR